MKLLLENKKYLLNYENKMYNDPEKKIVDDWTNKTDFHFALNKQNRGKTHLHN